MPEEFTRMEKARRALPAPDCYPANFYAPGSMWFCPWYHDPESPEDIGFLEGRLKQAEQNGKNSFLSVHYLRDWARKRPPITVMCPNGREWLIDQVSSNGTGWTVTGEAPLITAMPSIVVPGYHGWLKDGIFTDDIEGRGPNGHPG